MGLGLDELVRRGARQVIQQAIEAELAELLAPVCEREDAQWPASGGAQRLPA